MKQYSVADFRKNIREALNEVEAKKTVAINRHGIIFYVSLESPDDRQFVEVGASTRRPQTIEHTEPTYGGTDFGA